MRVVLGEDTVLLREGVARMLEGAGWEVAGQAGDLEDVLRKVRAHRPDLAIVDIRMPPDQSDEGLRAAEAIRGEGLPTRVLVLSSHLDELSAARLLGDGADGVGYLLKERVADVERFLEAARRVAEGGSVLDPEVVAHLMGRRRSDDPLLTLTEAERETLALMAEGRSNAAIAAELFLTERAVEKRVTSIFAKLDLEASPTDHRRVLAVLRWLQRA